MAAPKNGYINIYIFSSCIWLDSILIPAIGLVRFAHAACVHFCEEMIVDSLFAILYEFMAIYIQCMYMGYTVHDYQPGNMEKHIDVSTLMHWSSSGQKKPPLY